ncbi:hypothetical protein NC651_033566 [Populus alba x Populus x berolinensis]|nr:hypothetical protein NC651_033566 [Populus alba x Populus x berolinensis]
MHFFGRINECLTNVSIIRIPYKSLSRLWATTAVSTAPWRRVAIMLTVIAYDMEAINLATMPVLGELGISAGDRHMEDGDWGEYDFGDTMWNMDELWQFRNLQGKEN